MCRLLVTEVTEVPLRKERSHVLPPVVVRNFSFPEYLRSDMVPFLRGILSRMT